MYALNLPLSPEKNRILGMCRSPLNGRRPCRRRVEDQRLWTPRGLRQYRAEQRCRNTQAYAVTQALGETLQIEQVVTEYVAQQ